MPRGLTDLEFVGARDLGLAPGVLIVKVALHQNYKRLQEEVVCSEPNYYLWFPTPTLGARPVKVRHVNVAVVARVAARRAGRRRSPSLSASTRR